jgi:hypothetical protein
MGPGNMHILQSRQMNSKRSKSWDSKSPGIMFFSTFQVAMAKDPGHHILMSARLGLTPPESGIDEEENL